MNVFRKNPDLEKIAIQCQYSVNCMASHFDLSNRQFRYLFEKEIGISPKNWLIQSRVKLVIHMINEGKDPEKIWRHLFYSHMSHMRDEITKATGMVPHEIQSQLKLAREFRGA